MRTRGRRGDGGQALLFGVLVSLLLAYAASVVGNSGVVVERRVEVQNAADHAAYAGALLEANTMSAVAWLNEGMAYLYYHAMRDAVDDAVLAVLAEFKRKNPPAPDSVVGIPNALGRSDEAYARAREWIPRSEEWIARLGRIERALAIATPVVIEKEVLRVARENGSERTAFFPRPALFPDPGGYFRLWITEFIQGRGWELYSDTHDYLLRAIRVGDDIYEITARIGGRRTITVRITRLTPDHWQIVSSDRPAPIDIFLIPGGGIVSVPSGAGQTRVQVRREGGVTLITYNGRTVRVRQGPNGLEQDFGSGWRPIGQQGSVTIQGVQVRVDIDPSIRIGSVQVHIQDPPAVTISGGTHVVFTDPPQITSQVGPASIRVFQNNVWVNGLSIRTAQCRWYRYGSDRIRHRMCELGPARWMYEWVKHRSYLRPDGMERFGYDHAVADYEPGSRQNPDAFKGWVFREDPAGGGPTGWFDPRIGRAPDAGLYHQTRRCWHPRDLNCPVHGRNPATDPGPETNGFWHERRGRAIVRVECPICRGQDHDGDGITDVRVHQRDTFARRRPPYQSVQFPGDLGPLVLTEEFFKFGINVGVWREADGYVPSFFTEFGNPSWGYFALASARAGVWNPGRGEYRYDFPGGAGRRSWVEDSPENLYEPDWEARLWAVRDAIRTTDIDSHVPTDRGLNYLLRGLLETSWRRDYFDEPDPTVPGRLRSMISTRNGRAFDLEDPGLEDVMRH